MNNGTISESLPETFPFTEEQMKEAEAFYAEYERKRQNKLKARINPEQNIDVESGESFVDEFFRDWD